MRFIDDGRLGACGLQRLLSHPIFGASDRINRRWLEVNSWAFEIAISSKHQSLTLTHSDAVRMLGHPVIRQYAAAQWSKLRGIPFDFPQSVIDMTEEILFAGQWDNPTRILAEPPPVWRPSTDPFNKPLVDLIQHAMVDIGVVPVPPTPIQTQKIRQAFKMLQRLFPDWPEMFSHTQLIVLVRSAPGVGRIFESASTDKLASLILLSDRAIQSTHHLAEALLHEATHNKLYDIWSSVGILAEGAHNPGLGVAVSWLRDGDDWSGNKWAVSRSLAALHVYLHLIIFLDRLCKEIDVSSRREEFLKRAQYVYVGLQECSRSLLKKDGEALLDWLGDNLNELRTFRKAFGSSTVTKSQKASRST